MAGNHITIPETCAWQVDGLRYEGLAWGPKDGLPVLALHGWMDHAASFQELAPLLPDCRIVAIDLSGQGLSAHRAAHASYNIWDDLPQIAEILDQLGWADCVLMGHSRGANISGLFAAAQPHRVRALIALDALVPEPSQQDFVTTLQAFVDQTRAQKARPPRSFANRDAYIARRIAQGNAPAISHALAERALISSPEGVVLRGDGRMFASSAMKLKQPDIEAVMAALACPVLNIWALEGLRAKRPVYNDLVAKAQELIGDYTVLDLPGDHHFHLEPAHAPAIATAIRAFLAKVAA
jgi:pimeloyl-ACP methyl ester carboxylesterase